MNYKNEECYNYNEEEEPDELPPLFDPEQQSCL